MLRDYVSLTLGALTLLIASGAVYGILTVNSQIQAKSEPTSIPDYSNELISLKSQVSSMNTQIGSMNSQLNSMSGNLSTLDSMKNSLTDVKAKLIELEKNSNQASSSSQTSGGLFSVVLDKSIYLQGDTIKIRATGSVPQKAIQVELIDSAGYIVLNSGTWADSAGNISYDLKIPSSQLVGSYEVKLVSDQQKTSTPITIQSSTSSTSGTTLTAQTDKSIYHVNDLAQVSGTGVPNTAVTGVFTSPTGYTATAASTTNADGTWTIFFQILPSYETGTWTITLTNVAQTKSLSMTIASGSSTTLTAQTSKSTYSTGETIQVTGTGVPNTAVTGIITSPTGRTYNSGATVNSDGSYNLYFANLQYYETGTWSATINNSGNSKNITFYMQSSSSTFTAQTTQSTYARGGLVQVTGTGPSGTIVNGVLTSPSGSTYSASSTVQSDGTYSVFFQTLSSYPTGSWTITMTNSAQSKTLYILLQ